MNTKEVWLKAINGEPLDRIPFWPKLWSEYPGMQKKPFSDMSLKELHEWIGSDYNHMPDVPTGIREVYNSCNLKETKTENFSKKLYQTSLGEVSFAEGFDSESQSWHPVAHPVKTLSDINILTEFFSDLRYEIDEESLNKAENIVEKLGDDGYVSVPIGTSPLMEWVEYFAGVENSHLLLLDYQKEVEQLFEVLQDRLLDKTRLISKYHPADILFFIENTSTSLISPTQYNNYCFPHLSECAGLIRKEKRKSFLHMCGHIKILLPKLSTIDFDAFEAFTTAPLTDQSLLDGRTNCPDKCLIGGTNAVLWTKSAVEIMEEIKKQLDVLPHHRGIIITSGGTVPPQVEPEKIKAVCEWLREYPVRM
jgi:uroporphyrinogen-III decarboxylase